MSVPVFVCACASALYLCLISLHGRLSGVWQGNLSHQHKLRNRQVQDASNLVINGSSPASSMPLSMSDPPASPTAATDATTADSMDDVINDVTVVKAPAAFTDIVVERTPAARQPVSQPVQPTAAAPASKRRPSRFLQRHVSATSAEPSEPDVEASSPRGDSPVSDRGDGDGATVAVEGFGMDVARVTRSVRTPHVPFDHVPLRNLRQGLHTSLVSSP